MQKIITYFILVVLISSCSNKISLVKRKYNKGYYLSVAKQHKHDALSHKTASNNDTKQIKNTNGPEVINQEVVPASKFVVENESREKTFHESIVSNDLSSKHAKKLKMNSRNVEKLANIQHAKAKFASRAPNLKLFGYNGQSSKAGSDDTNTILMVILCILWWLNLVAVYLHDGRSITTNFWITLLLDLTIIGGIVFSILVILDIIDLR